MVIKTEAPALLVSGSGSPWGLTLEEWLLRSHHFRRTWMNSASPLDAPGVTWTESPGLEWGPLFLRRCWTQMLLLLSLEPWLYGNSDAWESREQASPQLETEVFLFAVKGSAIPSKSPRAILPQISLWASGSHRIVSTFLVQSTKVHQGQIYSPTKSGSFAHCYE